MGNNLGTNEENFKNFKQAFELLPNNLKHFNLNLGYNNIGENHESVKNLANSL